MKTEVEEWFFRIINNSDTFEKLRFIDAIDDYTTMIDELEKLLEQTPATDRNTRARIQSGIEQSKEELAKTLADYEIFKQYKARTTITK